MQEIDDFPSSPSATANSAELYVAYLKARDVVAKTPRKLVDGVSNKTIRDLTSHFYIQAKSGNALLRSKLDGPGSLGALWLSKVESLARWFVALNDVPVFDGLTSEQMSSMAKLSANAENARELEGALLKLGVVLIHEPAIPGAKIDGAAFKLFNGTPVVALSLRYPRVDHYWFTLMHELAHISLHFDSLDDPIVDDLDVSGASLIEKQADKAASDALIPRTKWRTCAAKASNKLDDVRDFAREVGVAEEIVAGRICREKNRHDLFSNIINRVNMREVIFGK